MTIFLPAVWWVALFWTYSPSWPRPFDDWKSLLFHAGAGFFVLCQVWRQKGRSRIRLTFPLLCILVYAAVSLLSLLRVHTPYYEGLLAASRLFLWAGLAWGISLLDPSQWRRLAALSVVSAALIALTTALQIWGIWTGWSYSPLMAPIGHVSYYGDAMALHIPLGLYLCWSSRGFPKRIGWFLLTLLILLGLWLSGTRASFAGFIAALLAAMILLRHIGLLSWRRLIVVPLIVTGILFSLNRLQPSSSRGRSVFQRFQGLGDIRTWADLTKLSGGRYHGDAATARMAMDRPFLGWGPGSFRFVYPEYDSRGGGSRLSSAQQWYMHPHNEFFHQAAETGFVGLIAFTALWGFLFYSGVRSLKRATPGQEGASTIMALSGLVTALVSWQFSTNYLFPLSRLLTALYAGILWHQIAPRWRVWKAVAVPRLKPFMALLVIGTTLFLGAYHLSLFALMKSSRVADEAGRLWWKKWAYYLAPGALDSLYVYSVAELNGGRLETALPAIDRMYSQYPFVPFVLFQTARGRMRVGKNEEARSLLNHALANDPDFEEARGLLGSLLPP